MAAIDFSDADAHERRLADPLNVAINDAVERGTAAAVRLSRMYLGASILGHECSRRIQYEWMCTPELPARVQRIFNRGHAFEPLIRVELALAGFTFAPKQALEFVALDGFLQGHADGIVTSGPALGDARFDFPAIWETKAINAKNWRAVVRNGFTATFPRYATQVALYQHFLEKPNPALVSCVNADTCAVLHLALPYDAGRALGAIEHARRIIDATRACELLPRFSGSNQDNFHCRTCQYHRRCWGKP
jgi:hypothetical protein